MAPSNEPGTSAQPRKQRKRLAQADKHTRRKLMSAHLSEDLMLEYDRRSMPVRAGDTVRITRGDFAGETGEVLEVDRERLQLEIDGVTNRSADGTQVPRPIHPSNVIITDLHLTDPKRRAAIERKGVTVEAPPEPEPEPDAEAEPDSSQEPEPEPEAEPEPEPEPEKEAESETEDATRSDPSDEEDPTDADDAAERDDTDEEAQS